MNLPTFVVLLIILAIFVAIIVSGVRNAKSGKGSCSCASSNDSCAGCPMGSSCHEVVEIKHQIRQASRPGDSDKS